MYEGYDFDENSYLGEQEIQGRKYNCFESVPNSEGICLNIKIPILSKIDNIKKPCPEWKRKHKEKVAKRLKNKKVEKGEY